MSSKKSIRDFSLEALEEEISRRKIENEKPLPISPVDLHPLQKLCEQYIDTIAEGEWVDEDTEHWFFEIALETFYGKEVWKWINKLEV